MATKRKRKKGSSIFGLFKVLILIFLIIGTLGATFLASYVLGIIKDAPKIEPENYRSMLNETSTVYDNKGTQLQTLVLDQFSEYVSLDKIPKDLQNAIIAVEDSRFYDHSAVDFRRILGALVQNIKSGRIKEGASTLTMQLAKNLYTSSQKSYKRKLLDIYYAYVLENNLTKEQILEAYLNSASFSKGTVGVQAASKTFFDKDVSELNLAESALVAGITNRPEKYTPYNRLPIESTDDISKLQIILIPTPVGESNSAEILEITKKLVEIGKIDSYDQIQIESDVLTPMKAVFNPTSKERQELILKLMLRQGKITQAEYDEAINTPINIAIGKREEKGLSSFYIDQVQNETVSILKTLGYSDEDAHKKLFTGGFKIYTSLDLELQKKMEEVIANTKLRGEKMNEQGIIQPQVASVLMDPHTGEVKALIGGRGVAGRLMLNRATTPRSPGSSIKPISVYMTAFKNGATAADIYLDSPLPKIPMFPYRPKNVGSYMGWTTVRNLIKRSSNVGALLVARDIGVDFEASSNKNQTYSKAVDEVASLTKIMNNLEDIGVTSLVWPKDNKVTNDMIPSSLALGGMTYGISPLEIAGAYTALANEGIYQKPTFVQKIYSPTGELVYENKKEGKEVLDKGNAWILTNILEDVVKGGTGTNAAFRNMHIAGKTGTTNDQKEAWFIGYTPYYLCSVFIGNDKHESLNFSSNVAASLWHDLMKPIHENLEDKEFVKPDEVIKKYVPMLGRSEYFTEKSSKPHYTNKLLWNDDDEDEDEDSSKDKKSNKSSKNDDDNSSKSKSKSKSSSKKSSSKYESKNYRTDKLNTDNDD